MRRRQNSRLSDSPKGSPRLLTWSLVLLALALLVWLWWQAGRAPERPTEPTPPPANKIAPAPHKPVPALPPEAKKPQKVEAPEPPRKEPSPPIETPPPQTNPPTPVPAVSLPAPVTNPPSFDIGFPRPPRSVFEAQVALARLGISCGSIDGLTGPQTRAALSAFQRDAEIPVTGTLDATTCTELALSAPPCATYLVTAEDLARLQPLSQTWLGKSQQSALEYETLLELVAEQSQTHPNLIRQLNPGLNWNHVSAGTPIQVPDVWYPEVDVKAGFLVISLAEKTLEAFDGQTNLLAHFPCSIAHRVEKRPEGELRVAVLVPHPNYTFNPEVFPESAEARQLNRKLVLPPGPNNPVGTAWIGLDKPGYGIHGTPSPEQVGRTESHGCFRLANWNAEYLLQLAWVGLPVYVVK